MLIRKLMPFIHLSVSFIMTHRCHARVDTRFSSTHLSWTFLVLLASWAHAISQSRSLLIESLRGNMSRKLFHIWCHFRSKVEIRQHLLKLKILRALKRTCHNNLELKTISYTQLCKLKSQRIASSGKFKWKHLFHMSNSLSQSYLFQA